MNGNNYNKTGMNYPYYKKGQVLLITIMLLATVLTVTMAVTFKSTTETQITKQEEEAQKALSAAEAGIEAALQQNTNISNIGSLPNFSGSGFSGNAVINVIPGNFATPLIQKDQQYTYYLADYPGWGNAWSGTNLRIYFMTETTACPGPAIELTFISTANPPIITRRLADPCNLVTKPLGTDLTTTSGTFTPANTNTTFRYQTTPITIPIPGAGSQRLLIVRSLFAPTKIGFEGTNLKAQGKSVTSEATSQTGVTKRVQLFQSYPQLPTEFFVTSF